jgi:kynurenine 3-monooxygenase
LTNFVAVEPTGAEDVVYQPYSHDGKSCIRSVSRAELNIRLLNLAEKAGTKLHFGRTVRRLNTRTGDMTIDATPKLRTETVIAADGAYSPCRHSIMNAPFVEYSQHYMEHGYKELVIPPSHGSKLKTQSLHIWPRGTYMMIALPNLDGSFTCTLFMPIKGGFDQLTDADKVTDFFNKNFADAVPLMPTLTQDFAANPTGSLVTVKCYPWSFGSHLTMVGDAAHAIVPFFGQGMNASFEDVFVLNAELEKAVSYEKGQDLANSTIPWDKIFASYQKLRKKNTDAIADLAEANYIEMRDKVADQEYQLLKKIQDRLGTLFPGQFISRYEMVSFSNIPYAIAQEKGQIGEDIARELLKGCSGDASKIDTELAKQLVDRHFPMNWIDSVPSFTTSASSSKL